VDPYFIIIVLNVLDWNKIDSDAVNGALNKSLDWIRAAGISWIVKTTSSLDVWYRRFEPLLPDGSEIYIGKIDLAQRRGLLQKATWDWISAQTSEAASHESLLANHSKKPE
jgi:hypothetical protein